MTNTQAVEMLDENALLLELAADKGAKFVLGPHAHRIRGLNGIPHAVGVATKGWLWREYVLHCLTAEGFLQCLRKG